MPGFRTHEVTGIELSAGDSRTVRTIPLEVAVRAERASVTAAVAIVPLNSGEKAATLTGDAIRAMPVVGTSAAEVVRLLPGMTPVTRGNDTNRPSFTGEVYGINGTGEYQGGGSMDLPYLRQGALELGIGDLLDRALRRAGLADS